LAAAKVRAEADNADEPLGARIRRAKLEKLPYILVVGDLDLAEGTVGVNARGSDAPERGIGLDSFVERLRVEAAPPIPGGLGSVDEGAP
jgi:threonyl-tRNA synthetase